MGKTNQSSVTEFVLLGLSGYPELEAIYFLLVLLMYLVILLGNGVIIIVNLSFLDICYTSSSIPLFLSRFLASKKTISFSGCGVQMFLSFAMGATECVLLSMMAFDCYVAICNPLRYPVIMSKNLYVPVAAGSWIAGGVNSVLQMSLAMRLPFCGDNVINHFTCEIFMVVANMIFLLVPVLFIFVSYVFILPTILRIPSAEGRHKAFSTCSAHLTVVIIFYGTILFTYAKLKAKDFSGADKVQVTDKIISLFYGVVTPMLNPLIYSLRNKDVKAALKNKYLVTSLTYYPLFASGF
uniref:G-protein coupled receptors family 1 profile domain-containing protein n=1 Tax=Monodon monoceros TaxID=40151 RepID=A0A8C6BWT2_MONMO